MRAERFVSTLSADRPGKQTIVRCDIAQRRGLPGAPQACTNVESVDIDCFTRS
jgi:hypothetical protein